MKYFLILLVLCIISLSIVGEYFSDKNPEHKMLAMSQTYTKPYKLGNVYYQQGSDKPFTGVLFGRYDNGNLLTTQEYVDGVGNGAWIDYDPEGNIERKGTYSNNKVEGPVTLYYENGSIKATGQYLHWKRPIGEWVYFDKSGQVAHRMTYTP